MTTFLSVQSLTLDLPPSCIQFCPSHPDLFVVGTYFLHGKEHRQNEQQGDAHIPDDASTGPQKRTGSLILFRLDHENDNITLLSTLATDYAVLDIQWSPHDTKLLAVAASTGVVQFYRLHGSSRELVLSRSLTITDSATLVLSCCWHPNRERVLGLTLSNGKVLCVDREAETVTEIHSHELEAWIMTFLPSTSSSVVSGGDDIVLQHSTIEDEQGTLLWQDRKLHHAGITSLLLLSPSLLITGSYDDHIRLLSLPQTGRRQVLTELDLGGGVWRLKLLNGTAHDISSNRTSYKILASCMHAGARILQLTAADPDLPVWEFKVLGKFEEHESMNYGSDISPLSENAVVSTSFYDKKMCLWRF